MLTATPSAVGEAQPSEGAGLISFGKGQYILSSWAVTMRSEAESSVRGATDEVQTVGRYQLCFQIAKGGMASIYVARARGPAGFEKLVALKRVRAALAAEPEFIEMFLDEARIASRISHANVCTVFDFGESDGDYFITMEFLQGEPLSVIRRRLINELPEPQAGRAPWVVARLIADACEGLHAAHELRDEQNKSLQVVHRDISPQNIYVTYDGIAKIVDFGIAAARDRLHETTTGAIKGKHSYMSPELLSGGEVDRRADVWAMGVVLWEMLARRPLFKGRNDSETLFRVVNGPIANPSAVHRSAPKTLDAIVLKALSRDPDERYQTAREMGRALQRAVAGHDDPIGVAEAAEWMGALFADEAVRKRHMLDMARSLSDGDGMISLPTPSPSPTDAPTPMDSRVRHTASHRRSESSLGRGWIVVGAVVLVSLGAGRRDRDRADLVARAGGGSGAGRGRT